MNKPNPAAAEPSMEEILASIRRIISDGDETLSAQAVEEDFPDDPSRDAGAEDENGDEDIFELTEEMAAQDSPDGHDDEDDEETMTRSAFDEGRVIHGFSPTSLEPEMPDVVFGDAPGADSATNAARDASDPADTKGAKDDSLMPPGSMQGDPAQPRSETAMTSDSARDSAPDHLMSPSTDANVAAAFGKLASTMLTQDSRTLEDLVKEMLRPMLREWLDDNLPSLVERLVRAEIERVSRGRP